MPLRPRLGGYCAPDVPCSGGGVAYNGLGSGRAGVSRCQGLRRWFERPPHACELPTGVRSSSPAPHVPLRSSCCCSCRRVFSTTISGVRPIGTRSIPLGTTTRRPTWQRRSLSCRYGVPFRAGGASILWFVGTWPAASCCLPAGCSSSSLNTPWFGTPPSSSCGTASTFLSCSSPCCACSRRFGLPAWMAALPS